MRRTANTTDRQAFGMALLVLLLLVAGCSINSDNPAGFEFTGRDKSQVHTETLTVTGADTTWAVPFPLESSIRLFVGAFEGFKSIALIRFTDLPAGAEVVEAVLIVRGHSISAAGDSTQITFEVSPISSSWDSSWTGEDRAGLVLENAVAQRTVLFDALLDTTGFRLPTALVQEWVDNPSAAGGVAIAAVPPAPFIVNLYSSEVSGSTAQRQPRLKLTYIPAGESASRSTMATAETDLSLMTFNTPIAPGELWVGRGAPFRSIFTFDVSHLPPEATINRAVLNVHIRPELTLGAPLTIAGALSIYDEPWTVSDAPIIDEFSIGFGTAVTGSYSTLAMVVTPTVGAQITRGEPVMNLLVVASYENLGVGLVRLLDSTAAPEQRATLELTYSLPPGGTP